MTGTPSDFVVVGRPVAVSAAAWTAVKSLFR
jgi:hypothetical protein